MKAAIFLATGFEESEAVNTIDILDRAGITVDIYTINNSKIVRGSHNIAISSNFIMDDHEIEFYIKSYDLFILPGGEPGTTNLAKSIKLKNIFLNAFRKDKYIAAICAAPQVLGKWKIITNQNITHFPGSTKNLQNAKSVSTLPAIIDGKIITGASIGCSIAFALLIIETLIGKNKRNQVEERLVIRS